MNNVASILEKVKVHPIFWVVLGICLLTAQMKQISIVFLLVFLHEMGHAAAATYFKWKIKKIELLPFGGVIESDEFGSRSVREENIVLLAGPVVHVVLLLLFIPVSLLVPIDSEIARLFVTTNISLLVFNLLPIYPLDGGRLLLNGLSLMFPYVKALKLTLISSISTLLLLSACFLIFAPFHLTFIMVALFLSITLYYEWKNKSIMFIRFLLMQYYSKNEKFADLKKVYAKSDDLVISVFKKFYRGRKHIVVLEDVKLQTTTYDENELYYAYFTEKNTTARLCDIYTDPL